MNYNKHLNSLEIQQSACKMKHILLLLTKGMKMNRNTFISRDIHPFFFIVSVATFLVLKQRTLL